MGESLYTAAQARELDRIAIEDYGIPGIRLMSRAGRAAFDLLLEVWPEPGHIHVFCGTGNNGGDGYIVAELGHSRSIPVTVYQLGNPARISGDARLARDNALAAGVTVLAFDQQAFAPTHTGGSQVVVDALLGTGLSGEVRGDYAEAIAAINGCGLPVLAIDIPSGLCSDTGRELGRAVLAEHTATFIAIKRGLLTGAAPAHVGGLHCTDLEVPAEAYQQLSSNCELLDLDELLPSMPARPAHAHKGCYGHALVVGGNEGMAGAVVMAAEAAARCGTGLVSAATRRAHVSALVSRVPEVMAHAVEHGNELLPLLQKPTAVAVGPGLGSDAWAEQMLWRVTDTEYPLVVDADALNLLARGQILPGFRCDNWILTPHPGEAARLLDCSNAEVQADRFAAVREIQASYGGVVLLKGAGTLVCGSEDIFFCPYGNPGMAGGGMGDVLSGVLVALLAQGLAPLQAACLGVCLHGMAADLAAQEGSVGLLATDLIPQLRFLLGD